MNIEFKDIKPDKINSLINVKFNFHDFMSKPCTFLEYGNYPVKQIPYYCPVCDPNKTDKICVYCFKNCHLACYQKSGFVVAEDNKEISNFTCECGKKKHTIKVTSDKSKIIDKQKCCFYELDNILDNKNTYSCLTCNIHKDLCYICFSTCHKLCKTQRKSDMLFEYKLNPNNNEEKQFYENENNGYVYTQNDVGENKEEKDNTVEEKTYNITSCKCESNSHGNVLALNSNLNNITKSDWKYESVKFIWSAQKLNGLIMSKNIYNSVFSYIEEFFSSYKPGQMIDSITSSIILTLAKNTFPQIIYYYFHPKLSIIAPYDKLLLVFENIELSKLEEQQFLTTALTTLILSVHLKQDFQSFKILSAEDFLVSTPLQRINMRHVLMQECSYSLHLRKKYCDDKGNFTFSKFCLLIVRTLTYSLEYARKDIDKTLKTLFSLIKILALILKMSVLTIIELVELIDALEAYYYKLFSMMTDTFAKYMENNAQEDDIESLFTYCCYIVKINLLIAINFNDLIVYNKYHKKMLIRKQLVQEQKHNIYLESQLNSNTINNSNDIKLEFIHMSSTHGLKLFKMTLSSAITFGNFLFYQKRYFNIEEKSEYRSFFKLTTSLINILTLTDNFYFKSLMKDFDYINSYLNDFSYIENLFLLEYENINLEIKNVKDITYVPNSMSIKNTSPINNPALLFKVCIYNFHSFVDKKLQLFFNNCQSLKELNKAFYEYFNDFSSKVFHINSDSKHSNKTFNYNYFNSNDFRNLNTEYYVDQYEFYQSYLQQMHNLASKNSNTKHINNISSSNNINYSNLDINELEAVKKNFYYKDFQIYSLIMKIIHFSPFSFVKNPYFIIDLDKFTTELIISNIDDTMSKILMIDFKYTNYDPRMIDYVYSFFELYLMTRKGTYHFIVGRNLRRMIKIFPRFPHKTIKMLYLLSRSIRIFDVNIRKHKRLTEMFNLLADYLVKFQLNSVSDRTEFFNISSLIFKTFINTANYLEADLESKAKQKLLKAIFNKKNLLEKINPSNIFSIKSQKIILMENDNLKDKDIIMNNSFEDRDKEYNNNYDERQSQNPLHMSIGNNIIEDPFEVPESNVDDNNFDIGYLKENYEKKMRSNKNKMPLNPMMTLINNAKKPFSNYNANISLIPEKQMGNNNNYDVESSARKLNNSNMNESNINNHASGNKFPIELDFISIYTENKYTQNLIQSVKDKYRLQEVNKFLLSHNQKFYLDLLGFIGRTSFFTSLKDQIFQSVLNLIDIDHIKFLMTKNILSLSQRISIISLIRWLYFSNFANLPSYKQKQKYSDNESYIYIKHETSKKTKPKEIKKFRVEFYDELRVGIDIVTYELKNLNLIIFNHQENIIGVVEYVEEILMTIKLIADIIMLEKMPSNINLNLYELTKEFIVRHNHIINIYNHTKFFCSIYGAELFKSSHMKESFMELKSFDIFETNLIYSIFSDTFIDIINKTDLFLDSRFCEFLKNKEKDFSYNFKPISLYKLKWSDYFQSFYSKNNFMSEVLKKSSDEEFDHISSYKNLLNKNNFNSNAINLISNFSVRSKFYSFNEKHIFFEIIIKNYENSFLKIKNLSFLESLDISQHDIFINYSDIFFSYCLGGIVNFNQYSEYMFLSTLKTVNKAMYYSSNHIKYVYDFIFKDVPEIDENYNATRGSSEFILHLLSSILIQKINLSLLLTTQSKIFPIRFDESINSARFILNFFKIISQHDDLKLSQLLISNSKPLNSEGSLNSNISDFQHTQNSDTDDNISISKQQTSINKRGSILQEKTDKNKLGSFALNPKPMNSPDKTPKMSNNFLTEFIRGKITNHVAENEVKSGIFELASKTDNNSILKKDKKPENKSMKDNKDSKDIKEKEKSKKADEPVYQKVKSVSILNSIAFTSGFDKLLDSDNKEYNFIEMLCMLNNDIFKYFDIKRYFNGDLPGDNLMILWLTIKDLLREFIEGLEAELLEKFFHNFKQNFGYIKDILFFKPLQKSILTSHNLLEEKALSNSFKFRDVFNMVLKYNSMDFIIGMIEEGESVKILADLILFFKPIEIFNEIVHTLNGKLCEMNDNHLIKFRTLCNESNLQELIELYRFSNVFYDSIELKLAIKYFDFLMVLKEVYHNSTIINFYENLQDNYKEGNLTENYLIFKFLSTIFLKIEVDFNESFGKDFQFFLIPPLCFQLSEQTKSNFLANVNRESTYTKILSLLNATDYLMFEMFFYDKMIKSSGSSFKFILLNIKIFYFELANYVIIFIQQILLFVNFQKNANSKVMFEPEAQSDEKSKVYTSNLVVSIIQIFYLLFTFLLWYFTKFHTRFTENMMTTFNKSFLFRNNQSDNKKISHYLISHEDITTHMNSFLNEISILEYFSVLVFDTILFNRELICLILSFLLTIIYLATGNSILLVVQVLFLVNLSIILYGIIEAVKMRYIQLLSVLAFSYLIVYVFSYFAFYYLYESMYFKDVLDVQTNQTKSDPEYFCNNSLYCFLTHLSYGVRSGGGIGDVLPIVSYWDDPGFYIGRIVYDITFHICVVWIMGNIFFGIIVDTFADLRDRNQIRENDINNVCYICQIDRDTCVTKNIDFDSHILNDHYVWNYVYFLTYLHLNNSSQFKKLESTVWIKLNEKDTSWLPNISENNGN